MQSFLILYNAVTLCVRDIAFTINLLCKPPRFPIYPNFSKYCRSKLQKYEVWGHRKCPACLLIMVAEYSRF